MDTKLDNCPFCKAEMKVAYWEGNYGWSHLSNECFMKHYDSYDYKNPQEVTTT